MGSYLRTLTTFRVKSVETIDSVLDSGQTVQTQSVVDILAVRPNRIYAEITADDMHPFLLYDGKNFTVYGQQVNYYATVPAPPTIAELIDLLDNRYGIDMPLVDLFYWGSPQTTTEAITSAIDIGPSTIEGTTCEQYAFRQDGLDWQVWIQQGDFPLPRKLVLTTLTDDARPRHSRTMTWDLAPSFNDEAFTFDPPKDAKRITLAENYPTASKDEKKSDKGEVK
jgi:hypothetical protein